MKLLINFLQSDSGGARSYLRNMLPFIDKWQGQEGCAVYILLYQCQIESNRIAIEGMQANIIAIENRPKFFKPLIEQFIVWKYINAIGADTVFTPYQIALPFGRVKNVTMCRNMDAFLHWQYPATARNRIRNIVLQCLSCLTLWNSDLVIAVSKFTKSYLINNLRVSENKITQIYHGRDHRFSPVKLPSDQIVLKQFNLDSGAYVFTSGSILPYRKLETIVEAFALTAAHHDIRLIIAGTGNDQAYKNSINQLIHRHHLEHRITQIGFVDVEKMVVLYRHSKFFVMASEVEACPNIAIEAMASGCRIIASNNSPLPEMFQDNVTFFSSGNSQGLAEKIIEELDAPQEEYKPVYNIDRFLWQDCADKTYRAITQLG